MNVVWSIAGSDSGGGAGIQADLSTFHDYQVHGCTVITALTAQNTQNVLHIQATTPESLHQQITALSQDLMPQAIKLGMLYTPDIVACVSENIRNIASPIIADPVLVSTSRAKLHSNDFVTAYLEHILPLATLVTPNIHEAEVLTGIEIRAQDDMILAAKALLSMGAQAVLIKGGDLNTHDLSSDYYADATTHCWMNLPRVHTSHTHGTGCTLSSAIAAGLAQGWSLIDAIILAKCYVHAGL